MQCCWTGGEWMVCRNERGASKSARNHGKRMSFEMVFDGCWDGLTVEYRPPTALSEQRCRSLQRATIIYPPTPQNVRRVFPLWRWYPQAIIVAFFNFFYFKSTYPLLQRLAGSLYPMATLDHICLEANWPWRTVEFQEETAGVAQNGTDLVPSP